MPPWRRPRGSADDRLRPRQRRRRRPRLGRDRGRGRRPPVQCTPARWPPCASASRRDSPPRWSYARTRSRCSASPTTTSGRCSSSCTRRPVSDPSSRWRCWRCTHPTRAPGHRAENLVALTHVPGIGRKGAQRIVLELKDRIGAPVGDGAGPPPPALPPSRRLAGPGARRAGRPRLVRAGGRRRRRRRAPSRRVSEPDVADPAARGPADPVEGMSGIDDRPDERCPRWRRAPTRAGAGGCEPSGTTSAQSRRRSGPGP